MTYRLLLAIRRTLLLALFMGLTTVVHAGSPTQSTGTLDARFIQTLPPDVRVIIDISGSMKQNDPQNLRRPALELLVQLFPPGSKAGVWTFGQWVNNLVPSQMVTDQWRDNARRQAQKINSVALRTNIPEALEKALLDADLDPAFQTHFILLTDGMVDVSKTPADNAAARQKVLEKILPRLRDAGVKVHTVALSQNADSDLMERLALETDGLSAVAETAEDLTRIFLQAFDAAAPAEEVPLEGNKFLVDSSIEEFTALVFRKQGSQPTVLVGPDKKRYSIATSSGDVRWFSQQNYDLITVKRPFEGEWTIRADLEPNSRVTIVSNLSLQVNRLPKGYFVGNPAAVTAALVEQGATVTRPEFLDLVDVSYEVVRRSDGERWLRNLSDLEPHPVDGVFADELSMFDQPGVYDIVVIANGKTFQRQQSQTIEARRNFVVSARTTEDEPAHHLITVTTKNPTIDTASVRISATIHSPLGDSELRTLEQVSERSWQMEFAGAEQSAHYQVELDIVGLYTSGAELRGRELLDLDHIVEGTTFVEPVVATPVVETPIAEPLPAPSPAPKPQPLPQPEAEPSAGIDWTQIGFYAALAMGNLLVLFLGYFAYKTVAGGRGSGVLEVDDEADLPDDHAGLQSAEAAVTEQTDYRDPEPEREPELDELDAELPDEVEDIIEKDEEDVSLEDVDLDEDTTSDVSEIDALDDILDLPDDAIDIDPDKP